MEKQSAVEWLIDKYKTFGYISKWEEDEARKIEKEVSRRNMDERSYFAIKALQGLLTNDTAYGRLGITPAVQVAVKYADALIEELNKEKNEN